jgi:hypothetical protein
MVENRHIRLTAESKQHSVCVDDPRGSQGFRQFAHWLILLMPLD